MIIDTLENAAAYYGIHPAFQRAFRFFKRPDLSTVEGRVNMDGEWIYALGIKGGGTGREKTELELHRKYIDIQVCLRGTMEVGWKPARDCKLSSKPYDDKKDVGKCGDSPDTWLSLPAGRFAIFFPADGHAVVGSDDLHRIVIKVALRRERGSEQEEE